MDMANYILQIFKFYLCTVMSWGFHRPVAIENGIRFNVQGYLHTGLVEVLYDAGYDLFTVRILNADGSVKKVVDGVYLDGLVDTIDGLVERCENYKERVAKDYGLIRR